MAGTGVFPVHSIKFKVGAVGGSGEKMIVKDMESFSISFDNNIEEWNAMDQDGWGRRLMTGKSLTIGLSGKRNYGDPGNDFIAGMAYLNGQDARCDVEIEFPNGDTLAMNEAVVNVSSSDGGGAIEVAALEFELLSSGKPTYTAAEGI